MKGAHGLTGETRYFRRKAIGQVVQLGVSGKVFQNQNCIRRIPGMGSGRQFRKWRQRGIGAGLPVDRGLAFQALAAFRVPLSYLLYKILARSRSHPEIMIPAAQTADRELARNYIFRIGKALLQQIVENVRLRQKHTATGLRRWRSRRKRPTRNRWVEGIRICFFADVRPGAVLPCFCFWTDVRLGAVFPCVWLGTLVLRTVFPRVRLGANHWLRTVFSGPWLSGGFQRRGGLKNFAIIARDGAFEELRCLIHALLLLSGISPSGISLSGISNVIRSPAA